MEAINTECLRNSDITDWAEINWSKVQKDVARLQTRIVKAVREGRHGKARSLQRILTHSFSVRALSVRRVTENKGKKTPGVDGVLWKTPQAKAKAVTSLKVKRYKAAPLKRIYIPKANGKRRPLGIPTMFDRAMQALHLLGLDPISETKADPTSFGFRKFRSTKDAIGQCRLVLARKSSAEWVLEGDIKGCFDHIDHGWLQDNIPVEKCILNQWLKSGFLERNAFNETTAGTPQGGIISPVLANMTLDGLEQALYQSFKRRETTKDKTRWVNRFGRKNMKVNFVRYADDFIITGASPEFLETQVKPLVRSFLLERGLTLSEEKTKVTHIEDGFDFLGFNIRKYKGGLKTKPSSKSLRKIREKIREVFAAHKASSAYTLVYKLNPILRGWADYHKESSCSDAFNHVSNYIWHKLKRWAYRRHPNKSRKWIIRRYFRSRGGRNWIFSGVEKGKVAELFEISNVRVCKFPKVKNHLNPYAPEWRSYLADRTFARGLLKYGKGSIRAKLWRRQRGLCALCGTYMEDEYEDPGNQVGTHVHHIVSRAKGGTNLLKNLALLHPACHRLIHTKSVNSREPERVS